MLVHGGGWCLGSKVGAEYARHFTAAGYLAADVEYRLAPGHLFPASCQDVQAAAQWLAAHVHEYGGDAARLGAYGASAGAHLVAWLAVQANTPLKCAVAWAGPMDMTRTPVTHPYRGYALAFMGACQRDDPEAYAAASPMTQVSAAMPPLLLIHGQNDDVVPHEHAVWMQEAARRVQAPVEIIVLPGVGHTGGNPQDPLHQAGWQGMFDFYARHLG